jgi:hypothetical protein
MNFDPDPRWSGACSGWRASSMLMWCPVAGALWDEIAGTREQHPAIRFRPWRGRRRQRDGSNPDCTKPTVGANAAQDGVITVGVAAHI